ncbi:tyrosine-type recombinase/integrase [Streptomyces europaeiscabiei]|uniref:tyrosine-type recombinase/integrase n=1 Tax=Streptomyces europaeiscabiei TaxID=146819 RepID=UPI0029BEB56F|nr:tyrosine-type recombinase/integrase [Streptomyces europaeiscabiei]MDX3690240.1 tyrosine-type recombinase/integrase [Streptomyces europaeiscabiei]
MYVRRVVGSGMRRETYTVVDGEGRVVEMVDDYLALCTDREHSPNTLRARAFDLKAWLVFLQLLDVDLLSTSPEHVDQFAGWLRRPVQPGRLRPAGADGPAREPSTVNRALNSVYMFYEFLARRGVGMGAHLTRRRAPSVGDHGGFLVGIAEREVTRRPTRLKQVKRRPTTLTDADVQRILDACERLRDRLLMALMFETGCRIGQALGLRHEDINTDRRTLTLRPREDNANRARGKSHDPKEIPVRQTLLDLYTEYLFAEYGELDCDYVFVNLWNGTVGTPMGYWAAMSLVKRLRRRTGVGFHPHLFRHTHATALLRAGVRLEVASELLTHRSVHTTADTYGHLDADDLAEELDRVGFRGSW